MKDDKINYLSSLKKKNVEFVEFEYNDNKQTFVNGELYSFINEKNQKEVGECIDYDYITSKVTLKINKN